MGALKNFFKYVGILLGLCLGVGLIVAAGMIVFGFELFGYKYTRIKDFSSFTVDSTSFNEIFASISTDRRFAVATILDNLETIEINADNIDVTVRPRVYNGNVDTFAIIPNIDVLGFTKTDTAYSFNVDLKKSETASKYILSVNVKMPEGLINYTQADLFVYVPFLDSTLLEKISLPTSTQFKVKSTYDVTVEDKLHVENLIINTGKGNITVKDNVDGQNNTTCPKATIYADNIIATSTSGNQVFHRCGVTNFKGETTNGNITFSSLTNGTIPGDVDIKSDRGKIKFESGVNLGCVYIDPISNTLKEPVSRSFCKFSGELCQLYINSIVNANVEYKGNSDFIKIGSATYSVLDIQSNNAHIDIQNIYGSSRIYFSYNESKDSDNKTGYRKIDINKMICEDSVELNTWSGDITIGTLMFTNVKNDDFAKISTQGGNIKIDNLIGKAIISSVTGNITVKQRKDYENNDAKVEKADAMYKVLIDNQTNKINEYETLKEKVMNSSDTTYKYVIKNLIDQENIKLNQLRNAYNSVDATAEESFNNTMKNSSIDVSSKKGTIKLENIVAKNIKLTATDGGDAPIYLDCRQVQDEGNITISSGAGNVYLTMPYEQCYWVYAKKGSVIPEDATFFAKNTLTEGKFRTSIITGTEYTTQEQTYKDTDEEKNTPATIDSHLCVLTVSSNGGKTTINKYKAETN